jgi:two-component system response regulator ResD
VVLLVDDERDLRLVTSTYLKARGYAVLQAGDARSARRALELREVDVVVLDLGLPDEDGLELLPGLPRDVAVLVVSARSEEPDRIVGLELGADDYLVKPFSQRELVARIAAVLRRRAPSEPARSLRFGPLAIDTAAPEVSVLSRPVALSRLEYELLVFLARSPARSFSLVSSCC